MKVLYCNNPVPQWHLDGQHGKLLLHACNLKACNLFILCMSVYEFERMPRKSNGPFSDTEKSCVSEYSAQVFFWTDDTYKIKMMAS